MLRGLDVSSCQGIVDWSKVPAEFRLVIVKVSEGTTGLDPMRMRNIAAAHKAGRVVAPYHFLRPSQEPIGQIANLWKAIGDTMPDFRPALDLESAPDAMTPDDLAAWFLRAADEAESFFGVPPLVYTYPWWYTSRLSRAKGITGELGVRLARCPLWMADYSKGEMPAEGSHPFTPLPWSTWTMWQTSGDKSSRVLGIAGAVDHDVFNGGEGELTAFRGLPDASQLEKDPAVIHPFSYRDEPPDSAA
jgi:GH25 family lysozyme M1 (1,4-beta-N-acetylmuramidase)